MNEAQILTHVVGMYASDKYIDVIKLTNSFGIEVFPNTSVTNARITFTEDEKFLIEVNPNHSKTRQRFSIAHEFSHYVLHESEVKRLGSVDRDSGNSLSKEQEAEANSLAAKILLPKEIVKSFIDKNELNNDKPMGTISINKIAMYFNVSTLVTLIRLRELGYYIPFMPYA